VALVTALAVGAGGVGGALARHAVAERLEARSLDTVAVNVLGSLLLGVVLAAPVGGPARLAAGAGFCGAFTTFSSLAVETVRLAEDGRRLRSVAVAVGTLALAIPAVRLGLALGAMGAG
jgi:CrcB protein